MQFIIPAAILAVATALTLQPWRWLWQARLLAAFLPWASVALFPMYGGPVVGITLIAATAWFSIRCLQSLMPVSIAQFAADLKPRSEGSVIRLLFQGFVCQVLLIVLLFRSDDEKGKTKEQAKEAGCDQRNRLRTGIRESRRALPAALAWRRSHWAGFATVVGVWALLTVTHLGDLASVILLAIPAALLTVALIEYRRVVPVRVVPRARRGAGVVSTIEN
ncbi:hypothetical protein SAMN05216368_10917 [Cryobacterium flavum]|uniref:Uncharacterized protein n=1 Tax=Cryobacterium flavum TaxID=1424659 RepID=A0A4R8V4S5_9MICO|nr:hypothetical protein [Cryobacterium flavum]TFB76105.1 hypothetical protein E3O21_11665 [Cryobacterium flavum]SDO00310.1 hypothetical protein SAMN05216368_10917 [Cryobacterium flavum]